MRLFLLISLCIAVTQAPYAQAYWGSPKQEKSKTTEYLRYAGDSVQKGYQATRKTATYGHEAAKNLLGYVYAARDYTLYSKEEYLASVVSLPVMLPVLSQAKWLELLGRITASAATDFDKAMDSLYLKTHIGGGNHRMFDGGHTLGGAWKNIDKMCEVAKCSPGGQVSGYLNALWKDMTTPKGLPFVTLEKQTYDSAANWMSRTIPGVDKQWVYDAFSYDVFEILSAGISAAAVIYYLDKDQVEELSELLGSMGIVSIVSANPILAMVLISAVAYALATEVEIKGKEVTEGAVKSSIISGVFVLLPSVFLVELAVVVGVAILLNRAMTDENYAFVYDYIQKQSAGFVSWIPECKVLGCYVPDINTRILRRQ
ncbi:MAG: hypothetical protein OXC97_04495 [Candidatus Dadabacteria bacterium]|nr:hypothetical protein [Candidatus Dadabacteria bacterium]